jgi:hypothetical protein
MRKYFPVYEEAVRHIRLCNFFILNFLNYDENVIIFFYQSRNKVLIVCFPYKNNKNLNKLCEDFDCVTLEQD